MSGRRLSVGIQYSEDIPQWWPKRCLSVPKVSAVPVLTLPSCMDSASDGWLAGIDLCLPCNQSDITRRRAHEFCQATHRRSQERSKGGVSRQIQTIHRSPEYQNTPGSGQAGR
jgi:hypothetical protein